MVSKARDDLPEPERPVITVNLSRGISTSMFLRLCCRAPRTVMRSIAIVLKTEAVAPQSRISGDAEPDILPSTSNVSKQSAVPLRVVLSDEVSTGSGSDRASIQETVEIATTTTRSLPLPVLTSSSHCFDLLSRDCLDSQNNET